MRDEFQRRRDYVVERLRGIRTVGFTKPEGAMFVFLSVAEYFGCQAGGSMIRNASDLSAHLLERHHVALVPGDAFGEPRCVRLSFACSTAELEMGIDRVMAGLGELRH
jgi:aspartate/methionine/tyrosine aminotransferase